jgi:hypothetical protein
METDINKKLEEENKLYRTYLENLIREGVERMKGIADDIKKENSTRFSELKEEMILFKTEILILKSKMWNRFNFYVMYGLIALSLLFSFYVLVSNGSVKEKEKLLQESLEKVIIISEELKISK